MVSVQTVNERLTSMTRKRLPGGAPTDDLQVKVPVETHKAYQIAMIEDQLTFRKFSLLGIGALMALEEKNPGTISRASAILDSRIADFENQRDWSPIFQEIMAQVLKAGSPR